VRSAGRGLRTVDGLEREEGVTCPGKHCSVISVQLLDFLEIVIEITDISRLQSVWR